MNRKSRKLKNRKKPNPFAHKVRDAQKIHVDRLNGAPSTQCLGQMSKSRQKNPRKFK